MRALFHTRKSKLVVAGILSFIVILLPLIVTAEEADVDTSGGSWLGNLVGKAILEIGAFFIWFGGMLLEMSVTEFVVEMGVKLGDNSSMGNAITASWAVVRDAANLAFIFGFIYIGIKTIIDYEDAQTKRTLATIIIAALLINFSLFFTKVIIDAGNILALNIYNLMGVSATSGIASAFAAVLGITGFYNVAGYSIPFAELGTDMSIWFYLAATILLLVAAFVFAAGGILLMIRFVYLIFIMILSPILFAATVFPQTATYAKQLWSKLINYALYPAVFLFLVYISFQILQSGQVTITGSNAATMFEALQGSNTGQSSYSTFSSILYYIIALMFLIFALLAAQKMSVWGGDQAVKVGVNMRKGVQGYAGRGVVRGTWLGRAAKKRDEWRGDHRISRRILGATLGEVGAKAADAKFGSLRSRTEVMKEEEKRKQARSRSKEIARAGEDLKRGSRDTATDEERMALEQRVANASNEQLIKLLKDNTNNKAAYDSIVANISNNQFNKLMEVKPEDFDDTAKATVRTKRAEAVQDRLIAAENTKRGVVAGAPGSAKIQDVIGKAEGKDLEALDFNTVSGNAQLLTTKQIDDMSNLPQATKARLKQRREQELVSSFGAAGTATGARAIFSQFKDSEAAKLPKEILTHPDSAQYLNTNILGKIPDNDSLSADDRATIKSNVMNHHTPLGTRAQYDNFFSTPRGNIF